MKQSYSWIALGIGLVLSLVLLFGAPTPGHEWRLPLLTSLLVCEVGFIITAIGVVLGVQQIIRARNWSARAWLMPVANLLLTINFARVALALWPGTGGG